MDWCPCLCLGADVSAEAVTWRAGHDVPGEGEHKIMEYIRLAKLRDDYKPNGKLALFQGDEHHAYKLPVSQVVKFGGGNKGQPAREILDNPCAEHFILFQIGCALFARPCMAVGLWVVRDWS